MSHFQKKHIKANGRTCLCLRALREEKRVTLRQMSARTKIAREHLVALETCQLHRLPGEPVYKKMYLKRYLTALGIDPTPYVERFVDEEFSSQQTMTIHPQTHVRRFLFANLPMAFRAVGILCGVFVLFGYLGFQVRRILQPPTLSIASPVDGQITDIPQIVVEGVTNKEVAVSINGKHIMNNEYGEFEASIDLEPGLNTIVVTAEKKHGKQVSLVRYVVFREAQYISYRP